MRDKLDIDIERQSKALDVVKSPRYIYTEGLQYRSLVKIRELCEKHNKVLILMSSPCYKGDKYFHMKEFKREFKERMDGYILIDHSNFPLELTSYGDIGHLNYRGAAIFSAHIQRYGLLHSAEIIE